MSETRALSAALRESPGSPGIPTSLPPPKLHFHKIGSSAYRDVPDVYRHITDPNEKRRLALAEIDKAPFGWYHVRMVVVTVRPVFTHLSAALDIADTSRDRAWGSSPMLIV